MAGFLSPEKTCATALLMRNSQMSCSRLQTDCLGIGKVFFSLDRALRHWQQCGMGCFSASCEVLYVVHCQNHNIKLLNLV